MAWTRKLSIEENLRRFHANYVKREDGCWQWIAAGGRIAYGHGVARYDGKKWLAHRLSYKLFKGEIGDKCVCHTCDNGWCVNPDHLWLGTQADNMHDRDRKKRNNNPIGESCHNAKLNSDRAKEALDRWRRGESQNRIAKSMGVSQGSISNIVYGKAWSHATGLPKFDRQRGA